MNYALITGGSRGIGRAIAKRLAADGLAVIINYVANQDAAEDTAREIREAGGNAELLRFDVSKPQEIEDALGQWEDSHPDDTITVLVNNAGIRRDNVLIFM
ncbi:MAG: SDR family NAD(P)-dependent oxidoreductase, partial [Muribaculaceae bacterium]|nr:SDR family NAD(P)-dependent oxidoreductase [Muribaculaceae bacterium]